VEVTIKQTHCFMNEKKLNMLVSYWKPKIQEFLESTRW